MSRNKRLLAGIFAAAAITAGAASPAMADNHVPVPPKDGLTATEYTTQDNHVPVVPQG
ncbi:hypothetical protein [Streptomyces sp. enrichment culture]|uniref:hypothetical protein n=1 Tax=Streptomyces sp. enrichment culture TaxID=1795815 RepID=UPI003F56A966